MKTTQTKTETKPGHTPGKQVVMTLWPELSNQNDDATMSTDWGNKTADGLAASIDNIINEHAGINLAAAKGVQT